MSDGEGMDTAEARYLDAATVHLARTAGGYVSLELGGTRYARVHFHRAFPATRADAYICLRDDEAKEIGILESLEGLAPDAAALLRDELDRRYYTPVVTKVVSLKEEFGYTYWEVRTDHGDRRFTVQSGANNVVQRDGSAMLLIDVDGNRFLLPDTAGLERKQLRVLEALL